MSASTHEIQLKFHESHIIFFRKPITIPPLGTLYFLKKSFPRPIFSENVSRVIIIINNFLHHGDFLWSEPSSSTVDFSSTENKTVLEKEAVLRLLVALSGSVASDSAADLGHQNDLWAKEPRQVRVKL